tara:strand:- start:46 stop:903 length:858 start_codon:yes stop_codon:yes gene_type:complete
MVLHYFIFSKIFYDYLLIGIFLFSIGFLDDIKVIVKPSSRLILMIVTLIFLINIFSISIDNVDLIFLNFWLQNKLFLTVFLLLCFLFIINGANLIDGFNGLLGINILVINLILMMISLENKENELSILIASQIIMILTFLLFNFPKAKIFLGDSGSYLFGALTSLNVIYTNNLIPEISSFFFCILLFYLFYEVLFSFLRKIIQKKSPLKPDNFHFHMLSYKLLKRKFPLLDCNYINSIIINLIFIILILPGFFFKDNGLICKYWFFSLLLTYTIAYLRLYHFTKN